jgi:hypothetical protein
MNFEMAFSAAPLRAPVLEVLVLGLISMTEVRGSPGC